MNLQQLLEINDWDTILDELKREVWEDRTYSTVEENVAYYDNKHDILTDPERQNEAYEEDGKPKILQRSREVYTYPRQIVSTKKGMIAGEPAELVLNSDKTPENQEAFKVFQDVWKKYAKLDSHTLNLVERVSVETKAGEIFFDSKGNGDPKDIRVMLLSLENGDKIYPFFNDQRDLEAITREYKQRLVTEGKVDDVEVVEVYTAEKIYIFHGGELFKEMPNKYGKIPAIYYDQHYSEWHWVKEIIDKYEKISSQHSDVNKRLGDVSMIIQGVPKKMPTAGDTKVFSMEPFKNEDGTWTYGDVKLLESEGASKNIQDELKQKEDAIYKNTWPDLSKLFDENATGNISVATMKLKFIPALIKIAEANVVFGEGMIRRVSVLKNMLREMTSQKVWEDIDIQVKFNSILPDNLKELVEILADAVESGLTSLERAVSLLSINKGAEEMILKEIEKRKQNQIPII